MRTLQEVEVAIFIKTVERSKAKKQNRGYCRNDIFLLGDIVGTQMKILWTVLVKN